MTKLSFFAAATLVLAGFAVAGAQEYKQGDVTVSQVWVRPAAEGKVSAAYFSIENHGSEADKLTGAESPVAGMSMLHETIDDNGVMKMRHSAGIEIPAGGAAELKPGGSHVMLMGLKQALVEGQTIPLTLTFAKAGTISVSATVQKAPAGSADHHHH
jgi:copper(I)-binding protein